MWREKRTERTPEWFLIRWIVVRSFAQLLARSRGPIWSSRALLFCSAYKHWFLNSSFAAVVVVVVVVVIIVFFFHSLSFISSSLAQALLHFCSFIRSFSSHRSQKRIVIVASWNLVLFNNSQHSCQPSILYCWLNGKPRGVLSLSLSLSQYYLRDSSVINALTTE